VTLRSENKDHKDIEVTEEMDMLVFGVVVAIARELL
jgi:SOS-response transcriptional repressor LexA